MKQAFIFDMDGLLIDSEPLWRIAEIECFEKAGVQLTHADCELTMGMRIDEVVAYWQQHFPTQLRGNAGQKLPLQIVNRMESLILEKAETLSGALELIDFAANHNIPAALASSSYTVLIEAFIKKFDLDKKIPVRVSAQEMQYGKPHPEIFIATAEKLNVDANRCTVFEDSINGVIAAKAAKMKCIAVPEISQLNNPKFSIADEVHSSLTQYLKQHQIHVAN